MPMFTYTMGVARAAGQNFTVILDVPAVDSIRCAPAPTMTSSQANYTVNVKRCGPNEVAFDVAVTAAGAVGDTLAITNGVAGLIFTAQDLNVAGNSVTLIVALKDPGETSQVDNAMSLSKVIAASVNAVNVFGLARDTATVVDVNNPAGPLFGFVAGGPAPADTTTTAAAFLMLSNNSGSAVLPDGVTTYDFKIAGGSVTVAVTDTAGFGGIAANPSFCIDVDSSGIGTCNTAAEIGTISGSTASFKIPAASFGVAPAPAVTAVAMSFKAAGTTSLGTGRSFGVSGTVAPAVGLAHALADPAGANGNFWLWSANTTVLQSPWMSTLANAGYQNRFILMNTNAATVGYTATCLVEAGNSTMPGASAVGTIPGTGIAVVAATAVCNFSGAPRGTVIFVIDSPAANIKGTFQQVNSLGIVTDKELERVYGGPMF